VTLAFMFVASVGVMSMAGAAVTATSRQQQAVTDSLGVNVASTAVRDSLNSLATDSMANTALFDSCALAVSCSWGSGSSWIALYGDSHAPMWATALVPALTAKGFRVAMNWMPGCTPARLTVQSSSSTCNTTWRTTAEKFVTNAKKKPAAVILVERTSDITLTSGRRPTSMQLQTGLKATIEVFKKAGVKVIIIGDNPVMMSGTTFSSTYLPGGCVSLHLTTLRSCDTSLTASLTYTQSAAEKAAAVSKGAVFIDTTSWFCSTTTRQCPSVIGNYVAYRDSGHLSFAYAATLGGLVTEALRTPLGLK
jgi:hypothetical protein